MPGNPRPPAASSPRAEVSEWIGPVKVTIAYCRPRVHSGPNDRTGHIWGEFVPYGRFDDGHGPSHETPWRAGANENTTITFSHNVQLDHQKIKAGTYALFLEARAGGPWVGILSSHASGWGSYQHDRKNDVLRVETTPVDAPFSELLTYEFEHRRRDGAAAMLVWEKKAIPLPIDVPNVLDLHVDEMRRELDGWPGFNYQNWQTAAQFCANNKVNLEEALVWADKAIHEPFRGAALGLARGYAATGDKAKAIEAWEEPLSQVPDFDQDSIAQYQQILKGLKSGG